MEKQIQTEPYSKKGLKNFKFGSINSKFDYFRHIIGFYLISLKFIKLRENFKTRTKNALLGYLLSSDLKKLLSYLTPTSSNFSKRKFSWKKKNL